MHDASEILFRRSSLKWHVSFVPVRADVDGWRGRHSFKLAVFFSV